jgi:predicted acyltransferase
MAEQQAPRWTALDVLRGMAVAGMILVTSPGAWDKGWWPLLHADWNGWTLADMIFPTFLFGVGMALALSFPQPLDDPAARARLWGRVARRVLSLIALGVFLNALMEFKDGLWLHDEGAGTLSHVRLPGILQRIALCYLLGVALIVFTARRDAEGRSTINVPAIGVAIAAGLIGYWAALTFVPVPGIGAGHLDIPGNLTGYIDRAIFGTKHLWRLGSEHWAGPVYYDPEGMLSTIPATTNLLFGVLVARLWQRDPDGVALRIAGLGAVLLVVGLALDPVFPINKRIWTSSFALLSSGFSALTLAAVTLALRSATAGRLAAPLRILGANAILAFTLSILAGIAGNLPILAATDAPVATPQQWGNQVALAIFGDPYRASYACALAILTLITLALWPLHRKGIHLRL